MRFLVLTALAILGVTSGGWMLFDGARRLLIGDYIRIDGQLGPWRHLFSAIGVDPMTRGVAVIFIVCGLIRLCSTLGLIAGANWGWSAMLVSSFIILWYLPIGTVTAILTIIILLLPATQRMLGTHP